MQGGNWIGDAWNWSKGAVNTANKWLKDTKAISRVGKLAGALGVPYAGTVGTVAGAVGYGPDKPAKKGTGQKGKGQKGGRRSKAPAGRIVYQ